MAVSDGGGKGEAVDQGVTLAPHLDKVRYMNGAFIKTLKVIISIITILLHHMLKGKNLLSRVG